MVYLINLGIALDMFLNALLGGAAGQTMSMRAALAAQKGNQIACMACRLLSWLVQYNHCQDQLDGVRMDEANELRAALGIAVLIVLLIIPLVCIFHLALYLFHLFYPNTHG